ncbi:MAG: ABC transporter permease [Polyangiales bacterium]
MSGGRGTRGLVGIAALAMLLFLAMPVLALVVSDGPGAILRGLRNPLVLPALALSLRTTALTTLVTVLLGTPLAFALARGPLGPRSLVETLVQLPTVLPPAVAGLGLLLAFGRRGLVGAPLSELGIVLSFHTSAVVLAQLFVAAPYYVLAASAALRALDPDLSTIARSLGAGPRAVAFRVLAPAVAPSLLVGLAMTFARALGEFGATLMFAGNLPGETQTMPLAIYVALESDPAAAQALALVLAAVAFLLLGVVSHFRSRIEEASRAPR